MRGRRSRICVSDSRERLRKRGRRGKLDGVRRRAGRTGLDRPWRRPGAVWYALRRLPGSLRPPVSVYEPAEGALSVLRDLPVTVRDGTILRVNVALPGGA